MMYVLYYKIFVLVCNVIFIRKYSGSSLTLSRRRMYIYSFLEEISQLALFEPIYDFPIGK